jgi:hypothetical protein
LPAVQTISRFGGAVKMYVDLTGHWISRAISNRF